jgi:hypothetical protein
MFGIKPFAVSGFGALGNDETFATVTGSQLGTISIGNITISGVAEHQVTGNAITPATGSVTITAGAVVTVDGSELSFAIGDTTISGDANVSVTGNAVTVSVGTGNYKAGSINASGTNTITPSSGTVTITADCNVTLTGSSLTIATTSAGVITWNEINLNASQTWTNVAA